MRLVLDTNIVASGLLWDGTPAQLIDAARTNEIELFTSRSGLSTVWRQESWRWSRENNSVLVFSPFCYTAHPHVSYVAFTRSDLLRYEYQMAK